MLDFVEATVNWTCPSCRYFNRNATAVRGKFTKLGFCRRCDTEVILNICTEIKENKNGSR